MIQLEKCFLVFFCGGKSFKFTNGDFYPPPRVRRLQSTLGSSPAPGGSVAALELEAAVNLLGLHLVVLVDKVQLAVAQRHALVVLPGH